MSLSSEQLWFQATISNRIWLNEEAFGEAPICAVNLTTSFNFIHIFAKSTVNSETWIVAYVLPTKLEDFGAYL